MRKTTRITWLLQLLSLGFLFHGVYSANGTDASSVSKDSGNATLSTVAQNTVTITMTTPSLVRESSSKSTDTIALPTDAGKKDKPTQTPPSVQPAAVATTVTGRGPPTSNPMVLPVPTEAQVTPGITVPVTNANPTTVQDATTPKVTPSQPHTTLPAPRSSSSGRLVGTTNAATVEPLVTATPGKTLGTKAPVVTSSSNTNVGTTQNAKVPTVAPPTSQRSVVDTTITAKTEQEGSQGGSGTDKMTVTDRSREQAASGATQPTGNMGPTSSPSTPAKAGPSTTVRTFTAKPGPTLTTSTPNPASGHRIPSTSVATTATTIPPGASKKFSYSLNKGYKSEEKELEEVCRRLLANFDAGDCSVTYHRHNSKIQFDSVEINGTVKANLVTEYYNEINKKPADNKTLIAILASCGALLIMIVILAVCASHHRKPYNENQQHLTEELHTVENGYHDNPTLEVMEVQPEMQEKKMAMNGEFNDSWIVPIDNLLKEDMPDEEDTHL